MIVSRVIEKNSGEKTVFVINIENLGRD